MFYSQNLISVSRRNIFFLVTFLLFSILLIRFYNLQVTRYKQFREQAEANRIRIVRKDAPRGLIFDRKGRLLVDNQPSYTVSVIPWEIKRSEKSAKLLCRILNYDFKRFQTRLKKDAQGNFIPLRIKSGIDFQTLSRIEEYRIDLPGVLYSIDPIRRYAPDVSMTHLLGYLREISPGELKKYPQGEYHLGDLVGWQGIEKQYEEILKGIPGYEYNQVDALGRVVGSVSRMRKITPQQGKDLYLTIDMDLQKKTESLLSGLSGAIVLMESSTGEILAMTSKPDYRLEMFAGVVQPEIWNELVSDSTRPLFNRALMGVYPPGSIFKIVAALTALRKGIISPAWTVHCPGYYRLGRRVFKCWKEGGHGTVNVIDAIEQSCNVFFYNLIRLLDIDDWAFTARQFGFGQPTGIDLEEESKGLLPDRKYMDSKYGKKGWTEGNKLNLVVGQGDVLVTPIQIAKFAAIIDGHGKYATPHVGKMYVDADKKTRVKFIAQRDSMSIASPEVWKLLEEALHRVVNGKNGTAKLARVKGVEVLGKTGTAQNPHGESHSWFMGIMRTEKRHYVISVLVEHGGSGGGAAARIAGELFRYIKMWENESEELKFALSG